MLINNTIRSGPTTKVMIAVSFIAIVALAAYNWVISPQITYLHAAEQYKSIVGGAGAKSTIIQKNIERKLVEIEKLQQDVSRLENSFFTFEKAREFFSDIQAMAEQTNCVIYSLNFSPTDTVIDTGKSEISSHITANRAVFSVGGRYKDIAALINKLQNRSKQVWIDSISIEPVDRNSELLKCDMSIAIYVIYIGGKRSYG